MAITSAICTSYKQEILSGTHTSANTYKIALYTSSATLDATTTAYSATNEVSNSATNYTTGGVALTNFAVANGSNVAYLDFATDPSWTNANITARGCMIYNSSQSNKAVCVLDFSADKTSTNGTFTIQFPAADSSNALLRLA